MLTRQSILEFLQVRKLFIWLRPSFHDDSSRNLAPQSHFLRSQIDAKLFLALFTQLLSTIKQTTFQKTIIKKLKEKF